MSLLARLAPHLPYVRRYARALTGDQTTGDHYVRVALEALAAGERTLETNLTPRVALYHVFHAIWCSSGAQLENPQDEDFSGSDDTTRRLMRIAPRSRQAFRPITVAAQSVGTARGATGTSETRPAKRVTRR